MQRLALLALILVLTPAITHASYSEEQFRVDVKQYLDQQTANQHRDHILNDPLYTPPTNEVSHSEYDIETLEDILRKQQEVSDATDKQIQDLLKASQQISQEEHSTGSQTPIDHQKECDVLIHGSYLSSNGIKCVCPANMGAQFEGDTLYCRVTTAVVTPAPQKKSGIDALFASFDKPTSTTSAPVPTEKMGLVRTLYNSVRDHLIAIFRWAF